MAVQPMEPRVCCVFSVCLGSVSRRLLTEGMSCGPQPLKHCSSLSGLGEEKKCWGSWFEYGKEMNVNEKGKIQLSSLRAPIVAGVPLGVYIFVRVFKRKQTAERERAMAKRERTR